MKIMPIIKRRRQLILKRHLTKAEEKQTVGKEEIIC